VPSTFRVETCRLPESVAYLGVKRDYPWGGRQAAEATSPSSVGTRWNTEPKFRTSRNRHRSSRQSDPQQHGTARDVLILTKRLALGIISTAVKSGMADPAVSQGCRTSDGNAQPRSLEPMLVVGAHACTDVTGRSAIGHLHENGCGKWVDITLSTNKVPTLPAAWNGKCRCCSGGTMNNLAYVADYVTFAPVWTEWRS